MNLCWIRNRFHVATHLAATAAVVVKGQRSTFIYRHLHEHDQQQLTMRSGVLTGNDTRWRSASSGSPLPE